MRLLICLPALNEEDRIVEVLASLPENLPGINTIETLVVDDGSTDRTTELAAEAGVAVIKHPANLGVGNAFHTAVEEGLRLGMDVLVTIDADGQFDSSEIPRLLAPILNGEADFVSGCRFSNDSRPNAMPLLRYWGNLWVASITRWVSGARLADVSCGFRAYSREALLNLNLFGKFTYTHETILDMSFKGLRLTEAPVTVRYFAGRKSRVAGNLLVYAINAMKIIIATARDFKPMLFFGSFGVVLFATGLLLDGLLASYYLRTGHFTPYKFVGFAGVTLNLSGILITGMGLLADMLNRIRINQERILYHQRRWRFDRTEENPIFESPRDRSRTNLKWTGD